MSPCEVPWTGVGEGEGALPWSSICYSPEEWNCVSFWVVSGEHPLCLCGRGREKQLLVYNSRKPTHAGIPKIDSHEEHPASSDLSSLRRALWIHCGHMPTVIWTTITHEHKMCYRNTVGKVFSSEQSSDLANITTPGRLDRSYDLTGEDPSDKNKGKDYLHVTYLVASECSHGLHSLDSWQRAAWADGSELSSSYLLEKAGTKLLVWYQSLNKESHKGTWLRATRQSSGPPRKELQENVRGFQWGLFFGRRENRKQCGYHGNWTTALITRGMEVFGVRRSILNPNIQEKCQSKHMPR